VLHHLIKVENQWTNQRRALSLFCCLEDAGDSAPFTVIWRRHVELPDSPPSPQLLNGRPPPARGPRPARPPRLNAPLAGDARRPWMHLLKNVIYAPVNVRVCSEKEKWERKTVCLCVCVCVCVCVCFLSGRLTVSSRHLRKHTHTHTRIHTHAHTHTHTHTHSHSNTHTITYSQTHTQ